MVHSGKVVLCNDRRGWETLNATRLSLARIGSEILARSTTPSHETPQYPSTSGVDLNYHCPVWVLRRGRVSLSDPPSWSPSLDRCRLILSPYRMGDLCPPSEL